MARKRKAKTELNIVVPNKKTREKQKEKKYDENPIMDVFVDLYKKTVGMSSKPKNRKTRLTKSYIANTNPQML